MEWDAHRSDVFWSVFLGCLSGWTGVYCVKQTQIQRYCCLKSKAKARKALWLHLPIVVGIAYLAMWCGVIIYAKYRGCDPVKMGQIKRHDQVERNLSFCSILHLIAFFTPLPAYALLCYGHYGPHSGPSRSLCCLRFQRCPFHALLWLQCFGHSHMG